MILTLAVALIDTPPHVRYPIN